MNRIPSDPDTTAVTPLQDWKDRTSGGAADSTRRPARCQLRAGNECNQPPPAHISNPLLACFKRPFPPWGPSTT